MSLPPSTPSDINLAAQLRAEADQAVKSIPGAAALGDGEFASVLSRVNSAMNPQDQLRLVASYAREIAIANRDEPRNLFDGRGPKQEDAASSPHGWHGLGARPHALWRGRSGSSGGGDGEGGSERLASGARFDGVNAGSGAAYWGSPAGLAQMRELAVKSGVGWMASNEGLLKLGPEAVKAVAQAHLKEGGYKILKGDLHMNDKEVVAGARTRCATRSTSMRSRTPRSRRSTVCRAPTANWWRRASRACSPPSRARKRRGGRRNSTR